MKIQGLEILFLSFTKINEKTKGEIIMGNRMGRKWGEKEDEMIEEEMKKEGNNKGEMKID